MNCVQQQSSCLGQGGGKERRGHRQKPVFNWAKLGQRVRGVKKGQSSLSRV